MTTSDDTGTNFTSFESMGNAIRYAAQFSDVISCSWGGIGSSSSFIDSAIDYATISARNGKGCAVFFASGNSASHWAAHQDRLPLTVGPGTYKFGFYFETSGSHSCVQEHCENLVIDQVRLLNQTGYDRVWWEDFEGGGPGWTVAHGGGATSDWALNTQPNLLLTGVGSTQGYRPPPLILAGQPGQWAELRSPALSLSGNYILAFAKLMDFSTVGAQFQIKLLDANDNLLSVLTNIPLGWGTGSVGAGYISYPASYVNSVAVGACTDFDRRADYSQYGPQLFCVGPSNGGWNGVASTDTTGAAGWNSGDWENGDYYMGFGGTSSATPLVAGVANLILSKNANLTFSQIKDSLRLGCDKIGPRPYDPTTGRNDEYGYGRVNAYASITNAAADTTAPTVTSVVTKWGRGVEVTFSEQMGDGVTTAANYTLSGAGKGTLTTNPSSVSWVSGYKYILEWSG